MPPRIAPSLESGFLMRFRDSFLFCFFLSFEILRWSHLGLLIPPFLLDNPMLSPALRLGEKPSSPLTDQREQLHGKGCCALSPHTPSTD